MYPAWSVSGFHDDSRVLDHNLPCIYELEHLAVVARIAPFETCKLLPETQAVSVGITAGVT